MARLISKPSGFDPVGADLKATLSSFSNGKPIRGGISIEGHNYWWAVEFGTGSRFQAGPAMTSGLKRPTGPFPHRLRRTGYSVAKGMEYQILAGRWYKPPRSAAKFLKFMRYGRLIRVVSVVHPGGRPVGMIRRGMRDFEKNLKADLRQLTKKSRKTLPKRKDFVDCLNRNLKKLHRAIVAWTPIGNDENQDTPLRDAWQVNYAS